MTSQHDQTFTRDDGSEVIVTFEFTPGTPETGRYNGPPENYDPGSGPELYIVGVRQSPDDRVDREDGRLTQSERDRFHDENAGGDWGDDGPDPDDARDAERDRRLVEGR